MRKLFITLVACLFLVGCTETTAPEAALVTQDTVVVDLGVIDPSFACNTVYTEIYHNGVLIETRTFDTCDTLNEARLMELFRGAFGDCTRWLWDVWCSFPQTPDL